MAVHHDQPSGRVFELDSLRGVAAIAVFVFHAALLLPPAQRGIFRLGVTGVDLFFVISGFVIFQSAARAGYWKIFLMGRFFRLFPLFWACVTITAGLIVIQSQFNAVLPSDFFETYLTNLTMVPRFFNAPYLDEQYWTLEVELLFYLGIAAMLLLKQLANIERIGYSLLAIIGVYDLFVFPLVDLGHYVSLVNHLPLFFAGILFSAIYSDKATKSRWGGILACYILSLMLFDNGGRSQYYLPFPEYVCMLTLYFALLTLVVFRKLQWLAYQPFLFAGTISYSFYVVHQYISFKVIVPYLVTTAGLRFSFSVLIAFLISILLAWLFTYFIEQPSMRFWKSRARSFPLPQHLN